jgi:hypothetical protein
VQRAVTLHPNTPVTVLARLGARHPEALLGNPALPLLMLENPALLADMPAETLTALMQRHEAPESFLVWAAAHRDPDVQLAVAQNRKTPSAALVRLAQSTVRRVVDTAQRHVNFGAAAQALAPRSWLDVVSAELRTRELKGKGLIDGFGKLLAVQAVPSEMLEAVALQPLFRGQVARWPQTPPALLERLAVDKLESSVATNPGAPAHLLTTLAQEKGKRGKDLRRAMLHNPSAPPLVLEQVLDEADLAGLRWIANLRHLSVALIEKVAKKLNDDACLLQRADCPKVLFDRVVGDAAERTKHARELAENPRTPTEILTEFADAKQHWTLREAVAGNHSARASVLEALAADADEHVRGAVAQNVGAPAQVLERLAGDAEAQVRDYISQNRATPASALERLAEEFPVRVAQNTGAGAALRDRCRRRVINTVAEDTQPLPRLVALLHAEVDPEQLAKAASSKEWLHRAAVAQHPRTSAAVRERLKHDEHPTVAQLARGELLESPAAPAPLTEQGRETGVEIILRELEARDLKTNEQNLADLLLVGGLPPRVRDGLAACNDVRIVRLVARDPHCGAALLELLSQHKDARVREGVAGNPAASVALLEVLAKSAPLVRRAVAENPNCPRPLLKALANDKDFWVRASVGRNPASPVELLETLAIASSEELRRGVAANPSAPASLVKMLAKDKNDWVRAAVKDRARATKIEPAQDADALLAVEDLRTRWQVFTRSSAAVQEAARASVVRANALSANPMSRLLGLLCPEPPPEATKKALRSTEWLHRYACAIHPKLGRKILEQLISDGHAEVAQAAAARLKVAAT